MPFNHRLKGAQQPVERLKMELTEKMQLEATEIAAFWLKSQQNCIFVMKNVRKNGFVSQIWVDFLWVLVSHEYDILYIGVGLYTICSCKC